jgi:hypothetical protein
MFSSSARSRRTVGPLAVASVALLAAWAPANAGGGKHYGVAISTGATNNMSFKNGVYAPTGDHAVLNVEDLEGALANGNVEVTTGSGKGGAVPGNIHVEAPLTWAGSYTLGLNAYRSIYIDQPLTDAGSGALTLMTNNGGSTGGDLYFATGANISIQNASNILMINSHVYTLAYNVASLPNTTYVALVADYDASQDNWNQPPIENVPGQLEGLGHTISNLTAESGLIGTIDPTGAVRNLHLTNVNMSGGHHGSGGLASANEGLIQGVTVTGKVTALQAYIGGLVAISSGPVNNCSTDVSINSEKAIAGGLVGELSQGGSISNSSAAGPIDIQHGVQTYNAAGGLVGYNDGGIITGSFASGTVTGGSAMLLGGLVGEQDSAASSLVNSYATGGVTGSGSTRAGGLIGLQNGGQAIEISTSYAAGVMTAAGKFKPGGVVGDDAFNQGCDCFSDTYWDTTTSGITNLSQGAGNVANDPGITGLSSAQLQAGLPTGFDPTIWAESPSINGGLPYLLANPPPQ